MDKKTLAQTSQERPALLVATLTSFMGPFLISAVNVALPAIQREMDLSAFQLSWIATAYLLAVAVGLVPAGKIGDIHGRKKVFAAGLAVSCLSSALAVLVTTPAALIGVRFLQGLGASMFVTTGMAILSSIFPPNRRGKAIGIYVSAVYVGLSVGPFIGGLLTEHLGWRSIFAVMVPFSLLCLLVTLGSLQGEWRGEEGQRLDLLGCLLYGVAILALVYGSTILTESMWIFLTGLGLLIFFWVYQTKARYPVFEVSLLRENRTFAFSSLAALLNYSASFSIIFLLSLFLQYSKGLSAPAAGTVLVVQPVMMALLSPLAGRLADRVDPRYLATLGMAVTVVGLLLFSRLTEETTILAVAANLLLLGTGFALFSSPNMSAIMGAVEKKHYGLASGTVSTMRLLGQMMSMAIATVVLSLMVGHQSIEPADYDRFLAAARVVFTISALLCSTGVWFSWFRGKMQRK